MTKPEVTASSRKVLGPRKSWLCMLLLLLLLLLLLEVLLPVLAMRNLPFLPLPSLGRLQLITRSRPMTSPSCARLHRNSNRSSKGGDDDDDKESGDVLVRRPPSWGRADGAEAQAHTRLMVK